ncbi:hypothetical protein U1Q18_027805 [Sarracenia purpurea var. burkii]
MLMLEIAVGYGPEAHLAGGKRRSGLLRVFEAPLLPSVGIGALSAREAEGRTNVSAGVLLFLFPLDVYGGGHIVPLKDRREHCLNL